MAHTMPNLFVYKLKSGSFMPILWSHLFAYGQHASEIGAEFLAEKLTSMAMDPVFTGALSSGRAHYFLKFLPEIKFDTDIGRLYYYAFMSASEEMVSIVEEHISLILGSEDTFAQVSAFHASCAIKANLVKFFRDKSLLYPDKFNEEMVRSVRSIEMLDAFLERFPLADVNSLLWPSASSISLVAFPRFLLALEERYPHFFTKKLYRHMLSHGLCADLPNERLERFFEKSEFGPADLEAALDLFELSFCQSKSGAWFFLRCKIPKFRKGALHRLRMSKSAGKYLMRGELAHLRVLPPEQHVLDLLFSDYVEDVVELMQEKGIELKWAELFPTLFDTRRNEQRGLAFALSKWTDPSTKGLTNSAVRTFLSCFPSKEMQLKVIDEMVTSTKGTYTQLEEEIRANTFDQLTVEEIVERVRNNPTATTRNLTASLTATFLGS